MRRVLGLLVYYDGGSVYRVTTPDQWAAMPDFGVIEAVIYFDGGRRNTLGGNRFYFYAPHPDGPIWASMNAETKKEIEEKYPGAIVKQGKWVPETTMERVSAQAIADGWES